MKRIACLLVLALPIAACAGTHESLEEQPVKQNNAQATEEVEASSAHAAPLWTSGEELARVCESGLANAAALRESIKKPLDKRTVNNTLISFNEMMKSLDEAASWASLT